MLAAIKLNRVYQIILSQHAGTCQCYQSLNCGGSVTVPGQSSLKDCCVNTDKGLSWMSGDGTCTNCIGKWNSAFLNHNSSIVYFIDSAS